MRRRSSPLTGPSSSDGIVAFPSPPPREHLSLIRDLSPSAQPTEDPAAMRAEIDRLTAALGADANAREQHERLLQVIVDSTSGWFDPAQIQQVLINLVKNAHEAGGPRDGVGIEVDAAPEGGVRFTVLDRGPGMSDDVMSRALVPAFTTKERGSGMGLTLCREIV